MPIIRMKKSNNELGVSYSVDWADEKCRNKIKLMESRKYTTRSRDVYERIILKPFMHKQVWRYERGSLVSV
jgi:hypothetical protein